MHKTHENEDRSPSIQRLKHPTTPKGHRCFAGVVNFLIQGVINNS